jgi:hypothetical protein
MDVRKIITLDTEDLRAALHLWVREKTGCMLGPLLSADGGRHLAKLGEVSGVTVTFEIVEVPKEAK